MDAELNRLIANLIDTGVVIDVQYKPLRVRVDINGRETDWLTCLQPACGAVRIWAPLSKGEQVTVLSPSGELGNGLVLRGIPSDAFDSPSEDPNEFMIAFPDGARIVYNHATGTLDATGLTDANVQGSGKATVDLPDAEFTGNVLVKGTLTVDKLLTYNGGMSGQGGEDGKTVIRGAITHQDGDLSSNGVVLHNHDHGNVENGGGRTDGPQTS
ncbi:phage baseplate assembly protein V [Pandoraea cepalis]|uniref:Phage baseplate assembly protein V n=1 Tax=Pandoraea cepalis TaxID=2508294 RepID=A0AAW7MJ30_9BURK|nr:phage baseplate assembly protein V [Pandoraea cepalis]MDN4572676.1 phage baseplate assembly protein V [Pandoraea cepalis]MDN4577091.1 phage baseplate assembly protein V [Pandoraea cepalis]